MLVDVGDSHEVEVEVEEEGLKPDEGLKEEDELEQEDGSGDGAADMGKDDEEADDRQITDSKVDPAESERKAAA